MTREECLELKVARLRGKVVRLHHGLQLALDSELAKAEEIDRLSSQLNDGLLRMSEAVEILK